jgi:hypothetical protein
MASRVASVIFAFATSLDRAVARLAGTCSALSHYGPKTISSAAMGEDGRRFAAARQSSTAVSRTAGMKGFCRLVTRRAWWPWPGNPDPDLESHVSGLPEITMIGVSGRCRCASRIVSSPYIPGMKISRNSRSNSSASNNARPLRPSPAALWPARSGNSRIVAWTALSSSTIFANARSPVRRGIKVNGRLQEFR